MTVEDDEIHCEGLTHVRIGEIRTATSGILKATLGSCVGIAMINRSSGVCGLAHCFLPITPEGTPSSNARYADTAAENLLRKVAPEESDRRHLRVFMTGGGRLLISGSSSRLQVGDMNVQAARTSLQQLGLRFTEMYVGAGEACNGILNCDLHTFESVRIRSGDELRDEAVDKEDRVEGKDSIWS